MIVVCVCNRVSCLAPLCGGKPKTHPRKLVKNRPRDPLPSSHYYLRSLYWTSGTFYFPDSRDLLEVLGDFLGRERGGVPRGSSRNLGDPPWGSLSAEESPPEDLEKVPRIWEGEGSRRSEILNPINNDYWVSWTTHRASVAGPLERQRPRVAPSSSGATGATAIAGAEARTARTGTVARIARTGTLTRPLLGPSLGRFSPIFTDFFDFLGRLHPRQTRLQKPPNAL